MFLGIAPTFGVINHYSQFLKMEIQSFKVEFRLITFHQLDNYGGPQLTIGQSIKGLILIGGEKDLKDNLNLRTY